MKYLKVRSKKYFNKRILKKVFKLVLGLNSIL